MYWVLVECFSFYLVAFVALVHLVYADQSAFHQGTAGFAQSACSVRVPQIQRSTGVCVGWVCRVLIINVRYLSEHFSSVGRFRKQGSGLFNVYIWEATSALCS